MPEHNLIPGIGDAKRIADANYLRRCVILFETECGRVGYSSYGKNKGLCKSTQRAVDSVFEDLETQFHEEFDGICSLYFPAKWYRTNDPAVNRPQG